MGNSLMHKGASYKRGFVFPNQYGFSVCNIEKTGDYTLLENGIRTPDVESKRAEQGRGKRKKRGRKGKESINKKKRNK